MPHRSLLLVICAVLLCVTTACGTSSVYRPGAMAGFDPLTPPTINDAEIEKAFDARPQLGEGLKVAYYTFDPDRVTDIDEMLAGVPNVAGTYRIPSLMATGKRRFDRERHGWQPAPAFSLQKLRLLAARAHCDVLLVFDYGYKVETTPNGLVALNALVVPIFFAPFLDEKVESYLDAYVIDVRNGYLYAHVASDEESSRDYETIWSEKAQQDVDAQWDTLIAQTAGNLGPVVKPGAGPSARADRLEPPAPHE
jgi:hypothetical protein